MSGYKISNPVLFAKAFRGKKDISKLRREKVVDKHGILRTVYTGDNSEDAEGSFSILDYMRSFFGTKKPINQIANAEFEKHKIKARFGLDKKGWFSHFTNFFENRDKWIKYFSDKPAPASGTTAANAERRTTLQTSGKSSALASKPGTSAVAATASKFNKAVMRFLAETYGGISYGNDQSNTKQTGISKPTGKVSGATARGSANANGDSGIRGSDEGNLGVGGSNTGERPGDGVLTISANGPTRAANVELGLKEAKRNFIRAHEILNAKKDSEITDADKAVLQNYDGAGGVGEGGSARDILTAFYTPRKIVGKMVDMIKKYLGDSPDVLEPAAGSGRFVEAVLKTIPGAKVDAVEINEVAARINKILNPAANVKNSSFESLFMEAGGRRSKKDYDGKKYDLVIGNPPYGAMASKEKGMGEGAEHANWQNYFIDRGMDTLKPGGILSMIVPSGFMSNPSAFNKFKTKLATKGKLLEAYRMPNGVFNNTDVGTDILVIRKESGDATDFTDAYFERNPDKVLGKAARGMTRFGMANVIEGDISAVDKIPTDDDVPAYAGPGAADVALATATANLKAVKADNDKAITDAGQNVSGKLEEVKKNPPKKDELKAVYYEIEGLPRRKKKTKQLRETADALQANHIIDQAAKDAISRAMIGNENAKGTRRGGSAKAPKIVVTESAEAPPDPKSFTRMDRAEFRKMINAFNLSDKELKIQAAMDWDGAINLEKAKFDPVYMSAHGGKVYYNELYASGDIAEKIRELENQKDAIVAQYGEAQYDRQVALLEKSKPEAAKLENISISAISRQASEFEMADGKPMAYAFKVWFKRQFDNRTINASTLQGVSGQDIFDYVNRKPVRAKPGRTPEETHENKKKAEYTKETRRNVCEELFQKWIQNGLSPEDQEKVVTQFNETYNRFREPDYKKFSVDVEGFTGKIGSKTMRPTPIQVEGLNFLCTKGRGFLAYDVGMGKTLTGVIATARQLQTGEAKRPMVCVPKKVYNNWIKNFKNLFPDIPINELGNLGKGQAQPEIRDGSVSICTYEALENMTFKDETLEAMQADLEDAMVDPFAKKRDKAKKEESTSKMVGAGAKTKSNDFFVEDLGFDHITVDEAHNFKNIFTSAKAPDPGKDEDGNDIKAKQQSNEYEGIRGASSNRGVKLYFLANHIQEKNNGRGAFYLSATPFTNSPIEIYNILSLVAKKKLKEIGLQNVNDFLGAFADLKTDWAVTAKGSFEKRLQVKRFRNLRELQNIIKEFIDFRTGEEAGLKRPKNTKHVVEVDQTPLQKFIQAECEKIAATVSKENPARAIQAITMARQATLSPHLVIDQQWRQGKQKDSETQRFGEFDTEEFREMVEKLSTGFVEDSAKLKFTFDSVGTTYKARPDVGQIVYMPRGVEYYDECIDYLVKQGIPRESIGTIKSGGGIKELDKIDETIADFNNPDGKIKVLIGSESIKEGVDLNGNTAILYNTMLGYNPSESIQVEGRHWRQGNLQENVHTVYPVCNDSIDSFIYQKHDEKTSRYGELWNTKGDVFDVESINPEEMKVGLFRNPEKLADYFREQKVRELGQKRLDLQSRSETISLLVNKDAEYDRMIDSAKHDSDADNLPHWNRQSYDHYVASREKIAKEKLSKNEIAEIKDEYQYRNGKEIFDRVEKAKADVPRIETARENNIEKIKSYGYASLDEAEKSGDSLKGEMDAITAEIRSGADKESRAELVEYARKQIESRRKDVPTVAEWVKSINDAVLPTLKTAMAKAFNTVLSLVKALQEMGRAVVGSGAGPIQTGRAFAGA